MKESIAILWDIENVTPSSNSLFVTGLIEYAGEIGRISVAMAYGDWTKRELRGISEVLAENSFEMMHVPHSRKNSSDITLITNAIEIIYQYPHIKKILLVTGDADFRPLLQSLRKHGIETTIICDAKSASEDLLQLADDYRDYRDLIATNDEPEERDEREKPGSRLSFNESIQLFKEAVQVLQKRGKSATIGNLKIRMKLLNDTFNEKEMRYKSWKDYVLAVAKADPSVILEYSEKDILVQLKAPTGHNKVSGESATSSIMIPQIIKELLLALKNCQASRHEGGPEGTWVPYSVLSQYLIDAGIDIREHNYSRARTLIEAAEKRGLVETHNENQHWLAKLTQEGLAYC